MKRTHVVGILGFITFAVSAYSQGNVFLDTYNSAPSKLVTYGAGSGGPVGAGVSTSFKAGIYWAPGVVSVASDPTGVADPATLGSLTLGVGPGSQSDFVVDGLFESVPYFTMTPLSNGPVTVVVVAFNGTNYATSTVRGHSAAFQITPAQPPSIPVSIGPLMPTFAVFSNAIVVPPPSPSCVAPPSGLVSWWPAENNASDKVSVNNGTVGAGVSFTAGEVGQSFQFGTSNAGIRIPASASLNVGAGAGFTIECWIAPQNLMASPILDWNNGTTYGMHFWVGGFAGPGTLLINLVDGAGVHHYLQSVGGIVKSNTLQHVATTYDKASGIVRLFCNGVMVAQSSLGSLTPNTTWDLYIGRRPAGTDVNSFMGIIDETSIYNRALTTNEILAIYQADGAGKCSTVSSPPTITQNPTNQSVVVGSPVTFSAAASGSAPLAYQWRWNGTNISGATNTSYSITAVQQSQAGLYSMHVTNLSGAADSSNALLTVLPSFPGTCVTPPPGLVAWWPAEGNANDVLTASSGALENGTVFGSGRVGQAFSFDGVNDDVRIPATVALNVGAGAGLTVEFWMNPADWVLSPLVEWNNGSGNWGTHLWHSADISVAGDGVGNIYANMLDTLGVEHKIFTASGLLVTNVYQHVALTYDKASGVAVLYLNGAPVKTQNLGVFTPQTSYDLYFGSRASGAFSSERYNGLLDEMSLYGRALGAGEIASIYGAGSAGKCTPTLPPTTFGIPQITSFTPIMGSNGTVVTLIGTNFSPVLASNIVYFGAVRAAVTLASPTSLTVVVPSGATYAAPSVTVAGLTGQASSPFVPTFVNAGGTLGSSSFAPKFDVAVGGIQQVVLIGDMDGDGKADLVTPNGTGNSVSVLRNISASGSLTAGSFAAKVDFPLPGISYGGALADVDGDGKLDIIAANGAAGAGTTVAVLRNTSTPGVINSNSFAPRVDFATATGPVHVAAGDLDGDGKLDLAVATYEGAAVSVLRNTSTPGIVDASSFAAKVDLAMGASVFDVKLGDLDGDGRKDIVISKSNIGLLTVIRNVSSPGSLSPGSFAIGPDFTVGTALEVAVGDLDGDGKLDVAAAQYASAGVAVLRNTSTIGALGSNSFAAPVSFATGPSPHGIAIGDLDGDGKPDLATPNEAGASVSVLRNTSTAGSINSNSFAAKVDFATSSNPVGIAIGDLDGDGRPDLLASLWASSAVSVLRNTVTPTPPTITQNPTNRTVTAGSSVAFNSAATGSSPLAYQWRWNGTNIAGATNAAYSIAAVQESNAGLYSVRVTNLLGAAESSNALLTVLPLSPVPVIYSFAPGKAKVGEVVHLVGTNFSPVSASNIVYFGAVRAFVTAASPTALDVVVPSGATYAPPSVTVAGLMGKARLAFLPTYDGNQIINSSSFASKVDFTAATGQPVVVVGDLDGDGKPDLVAANVYSTSIAVYRNTSSNGTITASSFAAPVLLSTGTYPYAYLADVDGDGKLDILVANNGNGTGNTISIYRNASSPGALSTNSFAARVNLTTATGPIKIAAGDLDGDGRVDLAVSCGNTRAISLFRNIGSPGALTASSFATRVDIGQNTLDRAVEMADLDGDGKLDLLATSYSSGTVSLFRNIATRGSLATNSFAPRVILASGSCYNVGIGDLDGDGKPDLAVDNRPGSVGIYRNLSSPGSLSSNSFAAKVSLTVGSDPYSVAIGDVDGDGKPDLAVSVMAANTVAVLRNTAVSGVLNSNSFAGFVNFATGSGPREVQLADLDADGKPDLVVANLLSSFVSVLKNTSPLPVPPSFVTQPVSQSVVLGDAVAFTASATGALAYQWQFNGENLSGQTNSSLILPAAQLDQAGIYTVVATNLFGPAASTGAVLAVTIPSCVPVPSGLVAWWRGENDTQDNVGFNHGTNVGGVGFVPGKVGTGFKFSGSGSYLLVPHSPTLNFTEGLSVELWFKNEGGSLDYGLIAKRKGALPCNFGVNTPTTGIGAYYNDPNYSAVGDDGSSLFEACRTFQFPATNKFYHFAATWRQVSSNQVEVQVFLNGSLAQSRTMLGVLSNCLSGEDVIIGASEATGEYFRGIIDEVSLYNRALDTNEIAAIYGARGEGKCPIAPTVLNITPPSWFVNEGETVSFTAVAVGTAPLSYQWQSGAGPIAGATSPTLVLSNVVYAQAGNYWVVVSNAGGTTTSSNVVLRVNRAPLANAGATDKLIISPNGSNAVAVLDGSLSSDPDGDALTYAWFHTGETNAFESGVVALAVLPVGSNQLTLAVNDGMALGSQAFTVEVITTSDAVDRLMALVQSDVPKAQSLLASLRAALASIDRSQPETAINQLEAFKNKVLAQVAPTDPVLANQLLADAQAIIDALNGGTTIPAVALEITSISQGNNGKPHLKIKGAAGRIHIVETSTDMVNWTKIGVAGCCGGCDYEFDDAQTSPTGARYYRVVSPK